MDQCYMFRTYRVRSQFVQDVEPTIIEALRATCALPNLFSPALIGVNPGSKREFVTALGFYNPAMEAIKEAYEIYPAEKRVACILNLGCGDNAFVGLPRCFIGNSTDTTSIGVATAMASIMAISNPTASWGATAGFSAAAGLIRALTWRRNPTTLISEGSRFMHEATQNGQSVAEELKRRIGKYNVYHRFSVGFRPNLNDLPDQDQAGVIEGDTTSYLQNEQVNVAMDACVNGAENYGYTPGNYARVTIKDLRK